MARIGRLRRDGRQRALVDVAVQQELPSVGVHHLVSGEHPPPGHRRAQFDG